MKPIFLLIASASPLLLALTSACTSTATPAPAGASTSGTVVDSGAGASDSGGGGTQCTAARDQLLVPVAKVATAEVKVVSQTNGITKVYVDASAGGFDQARKNPRVYITLQGTRVEVSDKDAPASSEWDLALKRQVLFTNSGDAGPGKGGGGVVAKEFDAVTAADASNVVAESFFDAECNAKKDEIEDPQTSFTGWYDYDPSTMKASAKKGVTFVVKSAAGALYKVAIVTYTGKPDGSTTAPSTGFYILEIAAL